MKKFTFVLLAYFSTIQFINAQQPMTIAPGLNITSPTAGTSGLKFNSLNSGTTVSTTPTKVLSLDATGNVILGNAASGAATPTTIQVPRYFNQFNLSNTITSPVNGMLAYLDDVNRYAYYNGTAWVSFPLTNPWVSSGGVTSITEPIVTGLSSTNAQLNVFRTLTTDAAPMARFTTGGNTGEIVTRYGTNVGVAPFRGDMYNTVSIASLPADASVAWKHVDGAAVTTPMMTLTGAGNMSVNGFTKLGGATDAPSIKQKYLTGNTNSSATAFTTLVTHGLDQAKIISVNVLVNGLANVSPPQNIWYSPNYRGSNNISTLANEYWVYFDATNITIERSNGQGQNLINKPYKILITYIQ